jgi:hypothetical protein
VKAGGRLSQHPNIAPIFGAGTLASGQPYLIMPFYQRGSLAKRIDAEGALGEEEVVRLGRTLAGALEYVHQHGVLHRDIKPSNILFSDVGEPLLCDFGVARLTDSSVTLHTTGTSVVTWAYGPPEAFTGGQPTPAWDVYSLGVTIYTMLTGVPPFIEGDDVNIFAVLNRIGNVDPVDLRERGVSARVANAVRQAMAKSPGDRPVSAAEFRSLLTSDRVSGVGTGAAIRAATRDRAIGATSGECEGSAANTHRSDVLRRMGSPRPPLTGPLCTEPLRVTDVASPGGQLVVGAAASVTGATMIIGLAAHAARTGCGVVESTRKGIHQMINGDNRKLRRVLLVAGAAVSGVLLAPAAAWAAPGGTGHTVTITEHIHGTFDPGFDEPNPCTGAAVVSAEATGNVVMHETFFPTGDEVWATFTETGKVTVVDSNNVTFTGHFTVWGNFNLNEKNTNNTFTLTIKLSGSDGSTITQHEVQHFALNANGVVTVEFDRGHLTCG